MTAPDAAIAGLKLALATIEDIPREPHERLSASRLSPGDHYSAGSADGYNRGLQAALDALSELVGNPLTNPEVRHAVK